MNKIGITVIIIDPYVTKLCISSVSSSTVRVGEVNLLFSSAVAGLSPFILDKCPMTLDKLTTLA